MHSEPPQVEEQALPSASPSQASVSWVPCIRLLTIERYRGIKTLTWRPDDGLNLILGGGDVGKTTILDAVALLLSHGAGEDGHRKPARGREEEGSYCLGAQLH